MIDINKYLQAYNTNYYCVFTFTFDFIGSISYFDLDSFLYHVVLENQQKAMANGFTKQIVPVIIPFNPTFSCEIQSDFIDGIVDVYNITFNPKGKINFEYAEFSMMNQLYPDTDKITKAFAVICQSYIDIMKPFPNTKTCLTIDFTTNARTFYKAGNNIWGENICPNDAEISDVKKTNAPVKFDGIHDPIGILSEFFKMYKYQSGCPRQFVEVNYHTARTTWDDIFK